MAASIGNTNATVAPADAVGAYISRFPPETQRVLQDLRALIAAAAPDAVEKISYGIPTFDLHGHHLVHFAAYEKHVGFYPTSGPIAAFRHELEPSRVGKGSVQFPLDRPLPTDLLQRMIAFRLEEASPKGDVRDRSHDIPDRS